MVYVSVEASFKMLAALLVFGIAAASASSIDLPQECLDEIQANYARLLYLSPDKIHDHQAILQKVTETFDVSKCMNFKINITIEGVPSSSFIQLGHEQDEGNVSTESPRHNDYNSDQQNERDFYSNDKNYVDNYSNDQNNNFYYYNQPKKNHVESRNAEENVQGFDTRVVREGHNSFYKGTQNDVSYDRGSKYDVESKGYRNGFGSEVVEAHESIEQKAVGSDDSNEENSYEEDHFKHVKTTKVGSTKQHYGRQNTNEAKPTNFNSKETKKEMNNSETDNISEKTKRENNYFDSVKQDSEMYDRVKSNERFGTSDVEKTMTARGGPNKQYYRRQNANEAEHFYFKGAKQEINNSEKDGSSSEETKLENSDFDSVEHDGEKYRIVNLKNIHRTVTSDVENTKKAKGGPNKQYYGRQNTKVVEPGDSNSERANQETNNYEQEGFSSDGTTQENIDFDSAEYDRVKYHVEESKSNHGLVTSGVAKTKMTKDGPNKENYGRQNTKAVEPGYTNYDTAKQKPYNYEQENFSSVEITPKYNDFDSVEYNGGIYHVINSESNHGSVTSDTEKTNTAKGGPNKRHYGRQNTNVAYNYKGAKKEINNFVKEDYSSEETELENNDSDSVVEDGNMYNEVKSENYHGSVPLSAENTTFKHKTNHRTKTDKDVFSDVCTQVDDNHDASTQKPVKTKMVTQTDTFSAAARHVDANYDAFESEDDNSDAIQHKTVITKTVTLENALSGAATQKDANSDVIQSDDANSDALQQKAVNTKTITQTYAFSGAATDGNAKSSEIQSKGGILDAFKQYVENNNAQGDALSNAATNRDLNPYAVKSKQENSNAFKQNTVNTNTRKDTLSDADTNVHAIDVVKSEDVSDANSQIGVQSFEQNNMYDSDKFAQIGNSEKQAKKEVRPIMSSVVSLSRFFLGNLSKYFKQSSSM